MNEEKLNKGFEIPREQIEDTIGSRLDGELIDYNTVISLKDICEVHTMTVFRLDVLEKLIRKVPLRTESSDLVYPYEESKIEVYGREPKGFSIGQTFVHSRKLLNIMSDLEGRVFADFVTKGLSKMPPSQIYGKDQDRKKVVALYIPPIIEIQGKAVLIDGIHRSYICKAAGTTVNAVHISHVSVPLPFNPISWKEISVVSEKPPIENRYHGLRRDYFRDFRAIGIDG